MKKVILVLSCLLPLLTACGGERNSRDVLRMNIDAEPDCFSPWKSAAADTRAIWVNIFEGLMSFDDTGKIIPCLAETVAESADHLTFTFNLRKNVLFHNGKPFTSEDAVFTYKNLVGLDGFTPVSSKFGAVESVMADGPYTFIVRLKEPQPAFLMQAIEPILPVDCDNQERQPVGSGPYKLLSYDIGQKVVLERNDNYWNKKALPKIKTIELYIMTDETAVVAALQSGQLDIAQRVTGKNARSLEKSFSIYNGPQNMVQILGMNNSFTPLKDRRVRKAVALAINKKEVIQGAFDGFATELYSNFSPILKEFYNDRLSDVNAFNINRAKELLKEAGYENGFDVSITVPANYQRHIDTALIIQAQLAKVNIRATINPVEWATWLDQVYTKFNYEMTVIAFAGKLDPADVLRRYFSTYSRNFTRFYSQEFDSYFSAAGSELDLQKRKDYYRECQRILAEESPAVFICDPNNIYAAVYGLKGFKIYPVSFYDFASMYFE